jgi:molybdopterin molybdotransferase
MIELEEAQTRILARVQPLPAETQPIGVCARRVLREAVVAPLDLPPFDNSAMDGYALQAADIAQATRSQPCLLRVAGKVAAGQVFAGLVQPGHCVRLFTGSRLPDGADAVVMQEDTRVRKSRPEEVEIVDPVQPWANVRLKGEDIKQGSIAAPARERLTAGRIGLLAALGCTAAVVGRPPLQGLIATGSELQEPGERLASGQLYESNRIKLAALAASAGARTQIYSIVPDDLPLTRAVLERAFAECDAVATAGGVSVGEFDLVKAAFQQLGGELDFWRVSIRPGKPFVFGNLRGKLLFGLPGNPVSAFVTFLLLVRPALLKLQGANQLSLTVTHGELAEMFTNLGDRRHFVRVRLESAGRVFRSGQQSSHLLHSLASATGLVDVAPKSMLEAGVMVPVLSWGE